MLRNSSQLWGISNAGDFLNEVLSLNAQEFPDQVETVELWNPQ